MQPEFDPKTHRLVKVDLTIWGCTHQQIDGGPLHAVGKVVRPRRRKKRPPKQGAGDYLDLQFEPAALWMSGSGRVRGLCVLSETEWHVLKALVEAGADGVEYGTLIDLVPGWDCEITPKGRTPRCRR